MKKVLLLLAGFVAGIAASMIVMRISPSSHIVADLHKSVIETDLEVLDSLSKGDEATAKLMLASSANSHIVMWEQLSSTDIKQKGFSDKWRRQMSIYNAQFGLSLPDRRVDSSKK